MNNFVLRQLAVCFAAFAGCKGVLFKHSLAGRFVSLVLLCAAMTVHAADELVVQIVKDGQPGAGLTAIIDGNTKKSVSSSGLVFFDLSTGAHSLQILDGEQPLHSLRFDAASGQLVDINMSFSEGSQPDIAVESYFKTESVGTRKTAAKGGIVGVIKANGIPLLGATVSVAGTNIEEETNLAGRYQIELPRGIYQLKIYHPDFSSKDIDNYRVISNVVKNSNFTISANNQAIEEVVVLAKVNSSAFEEDERYSANVIDTIGIEQIARFGDSDVAAAVVRIPSVTIQNNRFVFIRGLGGRYVTSTLNGATMPSTDPSKRTVPLDLFPSNIVSQLDVKKTFIASMPGESTGGNLVINTRTFPDERSGKLSLSLGFTDGLTGNDALRDPTSGSYDWAGWDAGERKEPGAIAAIAEILALGSVTDPVNGTAFELPNNVRTELQRLGAVILKDDLDLDSTTATPDVSIGGNYGDLFILDEADLGVFMALNYKNSWSKKADGIDNTYTPSGDQSDIFKFVEYSNDIDLSGLLSVGVNIGDSTYEANTIVSRSTRSRVRRSAGREGDEFQAQVKHSVEWVERQFLSQQFSGSHYLGEHGDWLMDWQITASQAERTSPDRRDVTFSADASLTDPQALLSSYDLDELNSSNQSVPLEGFQLEVNELNRRYDDLVDDNLDFSTNFDYEISAEAALTFGVQLIHRERDSNSSTYGIVANPANVDFDTDNLLVSDVITEGAITGDSNTGFAFTDETFPSDEYEAEMDLNSVYVSYDHLFLSEYQLVAGIRYEDYSQITETFDIQSEQGVPIESEINESTVLPTVSFNWLYQEDQQLRFAISKTVSRPDFKETSNAVFFDTEFDFRVRGNPFLEVSDVINYDIRWERYYDDQDSVSVALFYKDLDNPIERVVQPASGTAGNSRTFQNADSAEIYGLEIEGRKEFDLSDDFTETVFVMINAALIESDVTLLNGGNRSLQGQPEYTFNLVIGYDDIIRDHEITLLLNQNGETIVDVGVNGQPDIIEEPRLDIKVNYKYNINENFVIKASLENLLDEEIEFTQGGQTFQSYKKGLEFKMGIDWNF